MLDDLSTIATSANAAEAARRFEGLLYRVGHALCDVFGLTRWSVYLTSDATTFRGLVGFDAAMTLNAEVRAKEVEVATDLVTAELVRTRQPVVISDARTDTRPTASV